LRNINSWRAFETYQTLFISLLIDISLLIGMMRITDFDSDLDNICDIEIKLLLLGLQSMKFRIQELLLYYRCCIIYQAKYNPTISRVTYPFFK